MGTSTAKPTTASPFRFTFSPTVRANSANVANIQINSTPLGPLQQQYQQPNYNNNFDSFNFKTQTTTVVPAPSTQRNNFRAFNGLITTQSTFNAPQRQIVSVPTPFNHNNAKKYEGNDKFIINGGALTNNNNLNNNNVRTNNLFNSNLTSFSRQSSGRVFDNHNIINNYQTTSPFNNQRTVANHIPANNTILRLTNSFAPQISTFNSTNTLHQANQNVVSTTHPPTTTSTQIIRNSLSSERPNFNQQDLINQFNSEQRRFSQQKPIQTQNGNNFPNNHRSDAANYLSLEQKRLQLHYDINDYLTTDKYSQNQYSPTSEQYRSIQSFPNTNVHTNPARQQQSDHFKTQKYTDSNFSTTPKIVQQQFDVNKHYQTQQDRPVQPLNQQFDFKPQINVQSTAQPIISKQSIINNNVISTSTKKFSTLVPKENYAPTTFKPLFYFNVAKQINDNLSTPIKTSTDVLASAIASTTSRSNQINPIYNRNSGYSQFKIKEVYVNKEQTTKPNNITEIDENDGQYHPELYEKDFARYKIKNRKKQIQGTLKQNFIKSQNDFSLSHKQQQNTNRSTQKSFSTSTEEEVLNTAHSQNIVASGNALWANSKSAVQSKQSYTKAPTIPPNITPKEKTSVPKDDKDVSYDYAYYDSGNETPHEYSEFDLSDFGRTQKQ